MRRVFSFFSGGWFPAGRCAKSEKEEKNMRPVDEREESGEYSKKSGRKQCKQAAQNKNKQKIDRKIDMEIGIIKRTNNAGGRCGADKQKEDVQIESGPEAGEEADRAMTTRASRQIGKSRADLKMGQGEETKRQNRSVGVLKGCVRRGESRAEAN